MAPVFAGRRGSVSNDGLIFLSILPGLLRFHKLYVEEDWSTLCQKKGLHVL